MRYRMVALGDICQIVSGSTPSRNISEYWNGNINWFTPKDLSDIDSKYVDESPEKISELGYQSCSTTYLPAGSILYSSRAPIGHIAITKRKSCTNQGFKSLVPSENVSVDYLYYALKKYTPNLQDLGNGATFKELSKSSISSFQIPLPPLPIQQKIAAILDAADVYLQKTKALIEKYDQLTQSLFLEMFGDPVRNEKEWEMKPFEYFAHFDTRMTRDFEKYSDYPHIGIANIEKDSGKIIDYRFVKDEKLISGKYLFTPDHIIYSKIRPNLNKVALPDFHGLCSADAYPILVKKKNSNRVFFAHLLRSKSFIDFILQHSSRTNIPKANKDQMKLYHGIAPPILLQQQFANSVIAIQNQKEQTERTIVKAEQLFQNLLQRAFKGELVV